MTHSHAAPSDRARVRRLADRGRYDRETIDAVLDEGFIAHVGFISDGAPIVIPTAYARDGDRLLIHGSALGRMLGALASGVDICVTVTLLDGIVVARSAFHSSMNYRSVIVFGRAQAIEDPPAKRRAFNCIVEHLIPGRTADARGPDEKELAVTTVVALPLEEASVKLRTGEPKDAPEDYDLPIWGGVLPVVQQYAAPVDDGRLVSGVSVPAYLTHYARRTSRR